MSPWITGARDRAARNADTIGTTLHRIKATRRGVRRTRLGCLTRRRWRRPRRSNATLAGGWGMRFGSQSAKA